MRSTYMFYGIHCGFNKIHILQASDTTLGFYSNSNINKYIEIHITKIEILNQKYTIDAEGGLVFDKNLKEPTIFQITTYTKTGIIKKRYQITPKKGQKIKPFDYQEILP